jgi:HK97 family phage major capsid protein
MNINKRPVGLLGVRADASAIQAIADISKAFEEFKATNDANIAAKADVVATEKLDRINADITAQLDELNTKLAALSVAGSGNGSDPKQAVYAKAFDGFFRYGKEDEIQANLATNSKPDGGYLVPETMEAAIDRVLGKVSAIRALSRVVPISTQQYQKLVNLAGTASGWVGEEESRPATATPQLSKLVFDAMELYAAPYATQTMLDDARVNIEAWLAAEVQTEFAEQEGAAFVSGDGVKRPKGFLSYDKVANASYAWGKTGFVISGNASSFVSPTASASPADAIIDLLFSLKQGYRGNATFVMNDVTMASVRKFKDADGNYIWAPPTAAETVPTILGKPVVTDDNMPNVGADAFPIAVADWNRAYLIVDRAGVRVLRDPYTAVPNVKFYTTKRVGGGIQNFEAIKLLKIAAS